MKISIVIPVYNCVNFIDNCLNSIINQGVEYEVVMVDDHSTDNSFEVCKKMAENNQNIKLYVNDKKGVTSARNYGLLRTNGDVITFCDQDDFFEAGCFKKVIKDFESNKDIQVIITAFNTVDENNNKSYRGIEKQSITQSCESTIPMVINDLRITGSAWSKYYRRQAIENCYFDEDLTYAEDVTFVSNLLHKNANFDCLIVHYIGYNYFDVNPNNVTNQIDKRFDENNELKYIKCFERIREKIPNNKVINNEVGYKIVWYSIDAANEKKLDSAKIEYLKSEIRKNFKCFLSIFGKYGIINDIKRILYAVYMFTFY